MQGRAQMTESEIPGYIQEESERHQALWDVLIEKHTDGAAQVHMVKGIAASVIPEMGKAQKGRRAGDGNGVPDRHPSFLHREYRGKDTR